MIATAIAAGTTLLPPCGGWPASWFVPRPHQKASKTKKNENQRGRGLKTRTNAGNGLCQRICASAPTFEAAFEAVGFLPGLAAFFPMSAF